MKSPTFEEFLATLNPEERYEVTERADIFEFADGMDQQSAEDAAVAEHLQATGRLL
jgi:hypothetical protein